MDIPELWDHRLAILPTPLLTVAQDLNLCLVKTVDTLEYHPKEVVAEPTFSHLNTTTLLTVHRKKINMALNTDNTVLLTIIMDLVDLSDVVALDLHVIYQFPDHPNHLHHHQGTMTRTTLVSTTARKATKSAKPNVTVINLSTAIMA